MKYSLRSLFIAVTLFAVLLGGRVGYLRYMAVHHRREAKALAPSIMEMTELDRNSAIPKMRKRREGISSSDLNQAVLKYSHHEQMAERYDAAVYRPWSWVGDQP